MAQKIRKTSFKKDKIYMYVPQLSPFLEKQGSARIKNDYEIQFCVKFT